MPTRRPTLPGLRRGARSVNLRPVAPQAALWASDPAGLGQVGCIYTAQGVEYDWNGAIFDRDFRSLTKVPDEELYRLVRKVDEVLLMRAETSR